MRYSSSTSSEQSKQQTTLASREMSPRQIELVDVSVVVRQKAALDLELTHTHSLSLSLADAVASVKAFQIEESVAFIEYSSDWSGYLNPCACFVGASAEWRR